jgi:hypothetical protein
VRLTNADALAEFKRIFIFHGALGGSAILPNREDVPAEAERLRVVPLVFGLLPFSALDRPIGASIIKPSIRAHLTNVGIDPDDDELVDVLKGIADQLWKTSVGRGVAGSRKKGIADLRLQRSLYRHILSIQGRRCAICGVLFTGSVEETLDHMIPWRLLGDVPGGANWQILCDVCNSGKREWFSCLQSAEASNWIYGSRVSATVSREGRFVALASADGCEAGDCDATPRVARFFVERRILTALPVFDHLCVVCEDHRPLGAELRSVGS